jgi:hypothetical protein
MLDFTISDWTALQPTSKFLSQSWNFIRTFFDLPWNQRAEYDLAWPSTSSSRNACTTQFTRLAEFTEGNISEANNQAKSQKNSSSVCQLWKAFPRKTTNHGQPFGGVTENENGRMAVGRNKDTARGMEVSARKPVKPHKTGSLSMHFGFPGLKANWDTDRIWRLKSRGGVQRTQPCASYADALHARIKFNWKGRDREE